MANRPEEHPGVAVGDPQEIKLAKRRLSTARRNFTRSTNMLKGILNEDPNDENVNARAQAQMSTLFQRFSDLQLSEDKIEILQNKDGAEVDGAHQDQEEIYGRLQASYHSWLTERVQLPNAAAPFGCSGTLWTACNAEHCRHQLQRHENADGEIFRRRPPEIHRVQDPLGPD